MREGWTLRVTKLTEQFDYPDFQQEHDGNAVPLFLCTGKNRLIIYTVDFQPIPRPGQTLISLVEAQPTGNGNVVGETAAVTTPALP